MRQNSDQLQQRWLQPIQKYGIPTYNDAGGAMPPYYNTLAAQLGVSLNPKVLDRAVATFIESKPRGTIINLGAGLDNRFFRLDNGYITWYDVDVPEVIELRQTFFEENERYKLIAGSMFGKSLFQQIPPSASTLIIIEGLAMYYPERRVKALMQNICRHFSSCEVLLEVIHPEVMNQVTDSMPNLPLKWSVDDLSLLEKWHKKVFFAQELLHMTTDRAPTSNYFVNIPQPKEMIKVGYFKIG